MKRYLAIIGVTAAHLCANPSHLSIEAGRALARERGATLEVETSDASILNWETFSIQSHETTRFLQPSASSSVLNRVTGSEISRLLGRLEANGKVYLINPNGIVMGKDAVINTAAFFASTLQMESEEFLQGGEIHLRGSGLGQIENLGMISSASGPVCLLAHKVENRGTITGPHVSLGAGCEFIVQPSGETQLFVRTGSDSSLLNEGSIQALVSELQSDGVEGLAMNHKGIIQANRVIQEGGRVLLRAAQGTTEVSGEIHAPGGEVYVLGERVHLVNAAKIDVSCANGDGSILVGGDVHGSNPEVQNAKLVWSGPNTHLCADALEQGTGGKIILWGDEANFHYGTISAQGGPLGGDGGFVEISAPHLEWHGAVNTLAPLGKTGTLLLDPTDVEINDPVTTTGSWSSCAPPIDYNFVPGTQPNLISAADLVTQLGTCSVVIDTTASTGANTGSITVLSPISWAGSNSLSLIAEGDLSLRGNITTVDGNFTCASFSRNILGTSTVQTHNGTLTFGSAGLTVISQLVVTSTGTGTVTINALGSMALNMPLTFHDISATISSAGTMVINSSITSTGSHDVHFITDGALLVEAMLGAVVVQTDVGAIHFSGLGNMQVNNFGLSLLTTGGGDINFNIANDIVFSTPATYGVTQATANGNFIAGNNVVIGAAVRSTSGNLLFYAGKNLSIVFPVAIATGSGNLHFQSAEDLKIYTATTATRFAPGSGSILYEAGGTISSLGDLTTHIDTTFSSGGDINVTGTHTGIGANLLFLAGENFVMPISATLSTQSGGNLTIVADNNSPTSFGSGIIDIQSSSQLTTDGNLSLYAAVIGRNSFPLEMNSSPVSPDEGTCFVFYPNGIPASPFAIFYKICPFPIPWPYIPFGAAQSSILQNNSYDASLALLDRHNPFDGKTLEWDYGFRFSRFLQRFWLLYGSDRGPYVPTKWTIKE